MDYIARQAPLSMDFSRQEYWSRLPFPSPGDRTWVYPHCGQILYHLHHQGSNKNSKCSGHCLTRPSGMSSLLSREWLLRACTWDHLQGATLGPGGPLSAPAPLRQEELGASERLPLLGGGGVDPHLRASHRFPGDQPEAGALPKTVPLAQLLPLPFS